MAAKIIVGVDGSDTSLRALTWAVHEARRRNAELRVVACYTFPGYGGLDGAVYPNAIDIDSLKSAAATLTNRAMAIAESIDPTVVADSVTPMSSPVAGITEAAEPGDEIVVGATGHSGLLTGLLGSVAAGVIHRAHVPVVVVPAESPTPAAFAMRKMVVGVDGSPESHHALDWAYDEAQLSGAELTVVHAWVYPYPVSESSPRELRRPMEADAAKELAESMATLGSRQDSGSVTVRAELREDTAVDALLEEGADADLIVVGSRGRGGLRSRLLGSVSRTIVQHAPCPVAVIRGS